MRHVCTLAAMFVVVAAFSLAATAAPLPQAEGAADLLVRLRPASEGGAALQALLFAGDELTPLAPELAIYRLRSNAGQADTLARLRNHPLVAYAEPNATVRAAITPNDPDYASRQWAMAAINAPAAWDIVTGTNPITIAIIDTGIALTHPDLQAKLVAGTTFVPGTSSAQDDHGHGTHVAGVAAASTNNGIGMAGVSWGARLMPVKVLDKAGAGSYAELINGIYYAASHGAQILNMSLTGEGYSQAVQDAIDYAHDQGALLIAPAGNCALGGTGCSTINPIMYPAANTHVLSVVATDDLNRRATFSSHNVYVDVAAPGLGIYSSHWQFGVSTYFWMSGTSQAAPHVAGLAALIWSGRPSLRNSDVERIILATARDVNADALPGRDSYLGWGRIDALRAVDRTPPVSAVLPLPPAQREAAVTVAWDGQDENSGLASFTIQYRDGVGPWLTWRQGVTTTRDTFVGTAGHTYYFRSSATDVAGNVEPYAIGDGDASIHISTCSLSGTVRDNRAVPVAGASVTLQPDGSSVISDQSGGYTLTPANCTAVLSIIATRSGFGAMAPMNGVAAQPNAAIGGLDLYLPPADNLLAGLNWGFESGALAPAWSVGGAPLPAVAAGSGHTGGFAAFLGTPMTTTAPSGESAIAITVTVPITAYRPLLSFLYRIVTLDNALHDYVALRVQGQTVFSDGYGGTDYGVVRDLGWRHAWVDLSRFAGQRIHIQLAVVQGQAYADYPTSALVDEVSLGSASGGVYHSSLPVIIAGW